MNKKLMAVAVAGAFVTPALVFAQTATVQVYGKATVEYGYADQGSGRPDTDIFQTPGGSSVGFKGQEQLGGGLSAWFQCESSADIRGMNQDGFCGRNSAIGLKGGWGNVFFGRWDTPFKRATIGMVGAGDTGLLGGAFLFVGTLPAPVPSADKVHPGPLRVTSGSAANPPRCITRARTSVASRLWVLSVRRTPPG